MLREKLRACCNSHVFLDITDQVQTISLSVLGNVCQLAGDRLSHIPHVNFFPVDLDGTGYLLTIAVTEYTHCKLGTSCAHQSGKSDYLARTDMNVNIL